MEHWPEFLRNIVANLVSNIIVVAASAIGGLMLAGAVLLTSGLGWMQKAGIAALFGMLVVMLGAAVFAANRNRRIVSAVSSAKDAGTGDVKAPKLKIHSAFYGAGNVNDVDLTDTLAQMVPRDALAVIVDNSLIPGIADPPAGSRPFLAGRRLFLNAAN